MQGLRESRIVAKFLYLTMCSISKRHFAMDNDDYFDILANVDSYIAQCTSCGDSVAIDYDEMCRYFGFLSEDETDSEEEEGEKEMANDEYFGKRIKCSVQSDTPENKLDIDKTADACSIRRADPVTGGAPYWYAPWVPYFGPPPLRSVPAGVPTLMEAAAWVGLSPPGPPPSPDNSPFEKQ